MRLRCLLSLAVLVTLYSVTAHSQESTVYVSVVAKKAFVVGAANAGTGLHMQQPSADTTWVQKGPNNIRAFGVAAHPGTGQKVLYIASGNGVHKSTDAGKSWRITTGWQVTEVQCVCPDPRDVNTVYLACAYGIYRSTDGCASWTECNAGLGSTFSTCVIVDYAHPGTLYCATEGGAYKSTNKGTTWERMGLSVDGVRTIAQHPTDPDFLMVGTESYGIYQSTNGGKWWDKCEAGIDHQTFYTIAFDPQVPSTIYAAGYVTGIYKSVDRGNSWKRMNNGLGVLTFHSIAVDPRDSKRVFAAAYWGGVYRTDNAGESWRRVSPADWQVWTVAIHP
jgi:photosystem II stability/assembly factor-like uncharacterized protein